MSFKLVWDEQRVSNRILGTVSIWRLSYQYRKFYYKDKTVSRPSYLYNENSLPWKTVFILRWGLMSLHNCLHWAHCKTELGITYPIPIISFSVFSEWSNQWLLVQYHIHIISLALGCSNSSAFLRVGCTSHSERFHCSLPNIGVIPITFSFFK